MGAGNLGGWVLWGMGVWSEKRWNRQARGGAQAGSLGCMLFSNPLEPGLYLQVLALGCMLPQGGGWACLVLGTVVPALQTGQPPRTAMELSRHQVTF